MSKKENKKLEKVIASLGMSSAFTSLLGLMLTKPIGDHYLEYYLGGTLITAPFIYYGLDKIKEKINDSNERSMHHTSQIVLMTQEAHHSDHIINKMTSVFLLELGEELQKEKVKASDEELMTMNQMLYLINANYYDRITQDQKKLNREELVRRVAYAIATYKKETGEVVSHKNFSKILERCFFIKPTIQEEISKEFTKSKRFIKKGLYHYEIKRNDMSPYLTDYQNAYNESPKSVVPHFDMSNMRQYQNIAYNISQGEYINTIGNPNALEWDYRFLMRLMNMIEKKFRRRLVEANEYHSSFAMVYEFMANAMVYALANNKTKIGVSEMINTFKFWDYVPFEIQLDILDLLFTECHIDYQYHPYKISGPRHRQKVLKFPKVENN